jgi:hypothetical protein
MDGPEMKACISLWKPMQGSKYTSVGQKTLHQNHVVLQFFVWSVHQFIDLQIKYCNYMSLIVASYFDF